MAKPKKLKATRVLKPRKPKFKKVKNSFLQIGKSYNFYFNNFSGKDIVSGILLAVNPEEFLIKYSDSMPQEVILKRSAVIMISLPPEETESK